MRKIYLASSWGSEIYPEILELLRAVGHEVYDYREFGFRWKDLGQPENFADPKEHVAILTQNETVRKAFNLDMAALENCDTLVLIQPAGRSAHLELGYAAGRRKKTVVLMQEDTEPETMLLVANHFVTTVPQLIERLRLLEGEIQCRPLS